MPLRFRAYRLMVRFTRIPASSLKFRFLPDGLTYGVTCQYPKIVGPQDRPPITIVLIAGTPRKWSPNFGKLPHVFEVLAQTET